MANHLEVCDLMAENGRLESELAQARAEALDIAEWLDGKEPELAKRLYALAGPQSLSATLNLGAEWQPRGDATDDTHP